MPEKRFLQGEGHGLAGFETDEQRAGQTRAAGGGDSVQVGSFYPGSLKGVLGDGRQIAQVFAGGEFGHDAAVFGMELNLGGNDVGENRGRRARLRRWFRHKRFRWPVRAY